jgi:hypothetical protein
VIEELRRELNAVGIRGRARERILSELEDHLVCDPDAQLGDPRQLAAQFADELASDSARRTAWGTFGALALVAFCVGIPQAALPTVPDIAGGRSILLVVPATLAMIVGAQVAFAAGGLAALRALRFRGLEDVGVVRSRIAVALAAGAITAAGAAVYAFNFWGDVPAWWSLVAVVCAAAAALPLGLAAVAYARAGSLRVSGSGHVRGLRADLGPLAHPTLIGAAAVLAMTVATALLEQSLAEGLIRGAFETVLFALCFVSFRRRLVLSG